MTARYERIVSDIRAQIASGQLRPGDRLPSTRELRERYGCSQVTVRTAILLLQQDGLLRGDQGVGVFVADPLPESVRPGGVTRETEATEVGEDR